MNSLPPSHSAATANLSLSAGAELGPFNCPTRSASASGVSSALAQSSLEACYNPLSAMWDSVIPLGYRVQKGELDEKECGKRQRELIPSQVFANSKNSSLQSDAFHFRNRVSVLLFITNLCWIGVVFEVSGQNRLQVPFASSNVIGLTACLFFGVVLLVQFICMLYYWAGSKFRYVGTERDDQEASLRAHSRVLSRASTIN